MGKYIFKVTRCVYRLLHPKLSISGGKGLKAAGQPAGIATAGLVLGIIAVVLTAIFFFTCGLCTICVATGGKAIENAAEEALRNM